ncbi:MAG TPA: TetR/AcrR family transcriptional regulator [Candidatus Limnocylindrales bacterium]|jgi:AcrR family transcriptional regulator
MARTLNPESHAVRRDAFVDVAQRHIAAGAYEQLSVQQVIDEVGASKGAFYHYFGSKGDLLEAVVERMADQATAAWQPVLSAPGLSAAERLEGLFQTVAQVKWERRELVLAIIDAWLADDNAIVREKLRRLVAARLTPVLTDIVRQGTADGDFTPSNAEATAQVLVSLIQGTQELASQLYVDCHAGVLTIDHVITVFASYTEAVERVLGASPGSITLTQLDVLRSWF